MLVSTTFYAMASCMPFSHNISKQMVWSNSGLKFWNMQKKFKIAQKSSQKYYCICFNFSNLWLFLWFRKKEQENCICKKKGLFSKYIPYIFCSFLDFREVSFLYFIFYIQKQKNSRNNKDIWRSEMAGANMIASLSYNLNQRDVCKYN